MDVREPVTVLKGIGPKKAEALGRMHIETVEDLMRLFPREYEDRRSVTPIAQLQEGGTVTITATCSARCRIITEAGGNRRSGFLCPTSREAARSSFLMPAI